MAEPFLGQIILFGGNFAPRGYALCEGQTLSVAQNAALFSLLGTLYGGNGTTTFALPDLRGRLAMHWGDGPNLTPRRVGERDGSDDVTLTAQQIPSHSHKPMATSTAINNPSPSGALLGDTAPNAAYVSGASADLTMDPRSYANTGGGQPHTNVQPFLCVNFCIALTGLYPSRN